MIRAPALLAALLAATEAGALTCARPNPIRAFRWAQEAPESYVVLHGRLAFDAARMPGIIEGPPDGPQIGAPEMLLDPVPARFEGFGLDLAGFTRPVSTAVALQPSCLGPWCGSIGEGVWLLFAQVTEGGYRVHLDPCGTWAFEAPSQATLDALAACMRGDICGG